MSNGTKAKKIMLLLASTLTVMAGAMIAPALPGMSEAFDGVPYEGLLITLVLTLPGLFIALSAPLTGLLADRFGRKPFLLVSLVLYGIAGTSGLYLDDLVLILVGRALLGVSVAGVMTCTTTLIADYFEGDEREGFMGFQAAFIGFGSVTFLIAGGALADLSWRAPFAVYFASFLLLPGVAIFIDEPARQIASSATQARGAIRWYPILSIYAATVVGMMLLYVIPVYLPFHLTEESGASGAKVGLAIGVAPFFGGLISLQYRRIRRWFSHRAIYSILFLIACISFVVLSLARSYPAILVSMAIFGLGFGLLMPNSTVSISNIAPEFARARFIGGLTSCFFLGQFLSPIAMSQIVSKDGPNGVHAIFAAAAIISIVAAAIFFLMGFVRSRIREVID